MTGTGGIPTVYPVMLLNASEAMVVSRNCCQYVFMTN